MSAHDFDMKNDFGKHLPIWIAIIKGDKKMIVEIAHVLNPNKAPSVYTFGDHSYRDKFVLFMAPVN